jgi:hypothetical protein
MWGLRVNDGEKQHGYSSTSLSNSSITGTSNRWIEPIGEKFVWLNIGHHRDDRDIRCGYCDLRSELMSNTVLRCSLLTSICIPSSVQIIGHNCFHSCCSLSSVTFEFRLKLSVMHSSNPHYCPLLTFSLVSWSRESGKEVHSVWWLVNLVHLFQQRFRHSTSKGMKIWNRICCVRFGFELPPVITGCCSPAQ